MAGQANLALLDRLKKCENRQAGSRKGQRGIDSLGRSNSTRNQYRSEQISLDYHYDDESYDRDEVVPLGLCQPPSAAISPSACFGPQVPGL